MPVEFLSDDQASAYGQFPSGFTRAELERYFFLDDVDRALIEPKRRDHNRLGFAVQLVTVRYTGRFLEDPLDGVPAGLVAYLAEQLEIADPSCVKAYSERVKTRQEHVWEIRDADGWREFSVVEAELGEWVEGRAWTTGDGPKALFDAAVGWLRERRTLLPGVSTLVRLVASRREAASTRLWETLYALLTDEQKSLLDSLLDVADGQRYSTLDALRRPPTRVSGPAMIGALERAAEILGLGFGEVDASVVPPRRLAELSRYGMEGKATLLRRHPDSRRLATLLAPVVYLQTRAVDDALDLLDVLITSKLLSRAERESNKLKVKTWPKLGKASIRLAAVVGVLMEVTSAADDLSGAAPPAPRRRRGPRPRPRRRPAGDAAARTVRRRRSRRPGRCRPGPCRCPGAGRRAPARARRARCRADTAGPLYHLERRADLLDRVGGGPGAARAFAPHDGRFTVERGEDLSYAGVLPIGHRGSSGPVV